MNDLWQAIVAYGDARASAARLAGGLSAMTRRDAQRRLDEATKAVRLEIEKLQSEREVLEAELDSLKQDSDGCV